MPALREGSAAQQQLLDALVEAGHLLPTGVHGVFGRGGDFERVRLGMNDLVTKATVDERAELMCFSPLMPRRQLETMGYLASFPHMCGSLFDFNGDEDDAAALYETACQHEDWGQWLGQSNLVMTPAACYPVYPVVAARGPLPIGGVTIDPGDAHVFRHEPSTDPARMQTFHMRELVRIAEPDTVTTWRDAWRDRSLELLRSLGLDADFDVANDPFFGRPGRLLARRQRAQELKFEIVVRIAGEDGTAVSSFNYHQGYFTETYGITMADGGEAHTGCLAFGLERCTLALLAQHGLDVAAWDAGIRERLGL